MRRLYYRLRSLVSKLIILLVLVNLYEALVVPIFGEGVFWRFINRHFFLLPFYYGTLYVAARLLHNKLKDIYWDITLASTKPGERYENLVAKKLSKTFRTEPLQNVLIPVEKEKTTEADMLFVSSKGIFCIECKFHHDEMAQYFANRSDADTWWLGEQDVPNPFLQNAYHIRMLKKLIKDRLDVNIPIYNIVASTAGLYEIEDVDGNVYSTSYKNRHRCFFAKGSYLRITKHTSCKKIEEYAALPDELTEENVATLTAWLSAYCGSKAERVAHAERVQWETIKNVLSHTNFPFAYNKKKDSVIMTGTLNGIRQLKNTSRRFRKKYVILYINYLSVETRDLYTKFNRVRRTQARLKDVYITDFEILSYWQAKKHPEFKKKTCMFGSSNHGVFDKFLCIMEKVDIPPGEYKHYMTATNNTGWKA